MRDRRRSETARAPRRTRRAARNPRRLVCRALAAALVGLALCGAAPTGRGQSPPVDEPVELGREALRSSGRLPWYDASRDGVRPVAVKPSDQDAANRDSRWTAKPRTPRAPRGTGGGGGGFGGAGHVVGWSILAIVLIVLVGLLVYYFFRVEEPVERRVVEHRAEAETDARLQELPVDVRTGGGGTASLLDRARELMEAGRYNEAIIYFFSHLLVQLDRHQRIRLTRGKTNRQYLRELGPHRRLREITAQVTLAFEDAFFGNHPLSAERFDRCWQHLDEFHRLLDASGEGHG